MAHGKICYIEIPAEDAGASADFYAGIFGWRVRTRGDGARAFDDTAGAVSGSWVREPASGPDRGMLTYIMVGSIDETLQKIVTAGGAVIRPRTAIGPGGDAFAVLKDPAGNLVGLYQEGRADGG